MFDNFVYLVVPSLLESCIQFLEQIQKVLTQKTISQFW